MRSLAPLGMSASVCYNRRRRCGDAGYAGYGGYAEKMITTPLVKSHPTVWRYALAIAAALLAVALQWSIRPWVGTHVPFIFLTPSVVLCAILLGRSPAFAVLVIGAVNGALRRRLSAAIGVFELDFAANTAYVSPSLCRMLGQPPMRGAIPLSRWLDALHPAHVQASKSVIQQQIDAGRLHYEADDGGR
jgi:hypothetical protein